MQEEKPAASPEEFNFIPLVKQCTLINLKIILFQEQCPKFYSLPQAILWNKGENINFYKTLPLFPPTTYYRSS